MKQSMKEKYFAAMKEDGQCVDVVESFKDGVDETCWYSRFIAYC